MIKKILIANRGEIALRIIRTCKEMGIKTVAIHSTADADSLHVHQADEDVCIGPPNPQKSYLNINVIMSAAELTGADAIHPGYGFLSENARFADICEKNNIVFIGPSSISISELGNKVQAKKIMKEAGVPTIPGSDGVVATVEEAITLSKEMGYPVIVKASSGGGGRGMRVCHNGEELRKNFPIASSEAIACFNDGDLYLEKYFMNPRHIEIQLMADQHGNIIYLGERDCSVQRRHQKLIEESPSPAIDDTLRKQMGEAAINGAKASNYYSAGTMEFLYDEDKFYFMEMNTRIQVEHPVTEMVTTVDLIRQQILVAMGGTLEFTQEQIHLQGHSIECRINAEDPSNNFMPSPGKINAIVISGGPGVRVDTHVYSGYTVPPFYDSMVAKIIVHASNREKAISRMKRALDEFLIDGIKTSISVQKKILNHPIFKSGDFNTNFITEYSEVLNSDE